MTFRKIIFWVHLTVALFAGLFIFFQAVTGMLLAFEPQLVGWSEQKVRFQKPSSDVLQLSPEVLLEKAKIYKNNVIPTGMELNAQDSTVEISFGKSGSVFIDPYTAKILGEGSKVHEWMHTVEDLHRWLGSRKIGKRITGASCTAFFLLAISGIYLWWPNKTYRFNSQLKGKARDWNWHNVIGIWCVIIIICTTLTGIIMSYTWANNLLFKLSGSPIPEARGSMKNEKKKDQKEKKIEEKPIEVKNFNILFEKTLAYAPSNWKVLYFKFPQREDAPLVAIITEKAPWTYQNPRSQLSLDVKTAEVKKWQPFTEQNLGQQLRAFVKYIHTGQVAGFLGQCLVFLSALGVTFLVWTGFSLAISRFRGWVSKKVNK